MFDKSTTFSKAIPMVTALWSEELAFICTLPLINIISDVRKGSVQI